MIIGITGGIGSGKSTIAKALAQRGYTIYDCDREAKRIVEENEQVRQAIIDLLGPKAFVHRTSSLGTSYNTAYVSQRVFADSELLKALNAIIHPAVEEDIRSFVHSFTPSLLILESAILFEAGLDQLCDKIIVVDAPEDIRIARTIDRDYQGQPTPENIARVRARMHAQQPYTLYHTPYTLIINDGNTPIDELVEKIIANM